MNEQTLERFAGKTIYIMRETKNKFKKPHKNRILQKMMKLHWKLIQTSLNYT